MTDDATLLASARQQLTRTRRLLPSTQLPVSGDYQVTPGSPGWPTTSLGGSCQSVTTATRSRLPAEAALVAKPAASSDYVTDGRCTPRDAEPHPSHPSGVETTAIHRMGEPGRERKYDLRERKYDLNDFLGRRTGHTVTRYQPETTPRARPTGRALGTTQHVTTT
jgi:hypothetical protein